MQNEQIIIIKNIFKYKKTSLKQNKQTSKENQQIPMKTVTFQKSYLVIFTYFPKQINISKPCKEK